MLVVIVVGTAPTFAAHASSAALSSQPAMAEASSGWRLGSAPNPRQSQRRPAAELVIEMRASVPSQAEVYFDTGRGFNEAESAVQVVLADPIGQQLFFSMPTKTIRSIRFDPLDPSFPAGYE